MIENYIEVNGARLHYVERGSEAAGPAVILLHGSTCNARIWDPFACALARRMKVIALDLRGHGDSRQVNPPSYRALDYLNDLSGLVERLEIESAVIVAHSMSVYHAIRYALERPERVRRLVLVDIEAKGRPEHKQLLNAAGLKPERRFTSIDEAVALERRTYPYAPEAVLRRFVESNLRRTGEFFTHKYDRATLAQFDTYDEWDNLKRLRCPVLIVYGAQSMLVDPQVMNAMANAVPRGRAVSIDASAHLPQIDNPEGFERAVAPFCFEAIS